MARETRFNLIFIAILLVLLAPGAVVLFRKKMEPTVRPMYLPDPVRQSVAYLSPEETPPGMTRVAPRHTAEWTAGIVAAEMPGLEALRPRDEEGLPVMSMPGKRFEVLGYAGVGDRITVVVAFWGSPPTESVAWRIGDAPASVESSRELEIPRLVREELGANGVLVPPKRLVVQQIIAARQTSGEVSVSYANAEGQRDGEADSANFVTSFTSPAPTSN